MRYKRELTVRACAIFVASMFFVTSAPAAPEPWYFNFGLGYGMCSYQSELNDSLKVLKSACFSHTPLAVDIGVYFPTTDVTTLGASINGVSDTFSKDRDSINLVTTGLFFSTMHSLSGEEPGSGLFLRGDAGFARSGLDATYRETSTTRTSEYGVGINVGVGYGIASQ